MIERRTFGNTGIELSIIGMGGVTVMNMPQSEASSLIHTALDRGINYFDVAPSYGDSEEKYGKALKGYRDQIFLSCKTGMRKKEEAAAELRQSLKRLDTDYIDLYQFHNLACMEDVELVFGKDGAMEAFLDAKREGLIRYIGFSAHSVRAALTAMDLFDFDAILFPINYVLYYKGNIGPQVLEKAQENGVARLAIKALAKGKWQEEANTNEFPNLWYEPLSNPNIVRKALRFTLSLPITATIPSGDKVIFEIAMNAASEFTPITDEEKEELKNAAQKQDLIMTLDI